MSGYHPRFHLDVYGTIGYIFNNDPEKISDYLGRLEQTCRPFPVTVECPIDLPDKNHLITQMKSLKNNDKIQAALERRQ